MDVLVVLLIIFLSLFAIVKYNYYQQGFDQEVSKYGLWAVSAISFLLEVIPQFIHPFSSAILAVGFGANVWLATGFSIAGSLLGAIVGFEIGRKFGFQVIRPFLNKRKLEKTLTKIDDYGAIFIVIAALLPVPYLPVLFGSLGITRKTFWGYGVMIRAASFVCLGILLNFGIKFL